MKEKTISKDLENLNKSSKKLNLFFDEIAKISGNKGLELGISSVSLLNKRTSHPLLSERISDGSYRNIVYSYVDQDRLASFLLKSINKEIFTVIANYFDSKFQFETNNAEKLMSILEKSFNSINDFDNPISFKTIQKKKAIDYIATGRAKKSRCSFSFNNLIKVQNIKGKKHQTYVNYELKLKFHDGELIPVVYIAVPQSIYHSSKLKFIVFADGTDRAFVKFNSSWEAFKFNEKGINDIILNYEYKCKLTHYNALKKSLGNDFTMSKKDFLELDEDLKSEFYLTSKMMHM